MSTPNSGLTLRGPGPGDWGWIVSRHGALYGAEYGWGHGFTLESEPGPFPFDPARTEQIWSRAL